MKNHYAIIFAIVASALLIVLHYFFGVLSFHFLPQIPFSYDFPLKEDYIKPSYIAATPIKLGIADVWKAYSWDSINYIGIAQNGYERIPFTTDTIHNWAYFPLYPMVIGGIAKLGLYDNDAHLVFLSGVFISILLFFGGVGLLKKLTDKLNLSTTDYLSILLLMLAFPTSYFYHMFYTESLFFILSIGFFLALFTKRYFVSALVLAMALVTRSNAITLLPAFYLYFIIKEWNKPKMTGFLKLVGYSFLMATPVLLFFLHLYDITGEFFAAYKIQTVWYNSFKPFGAITSYLKTFDFTIHYHFILSIILLLTLSISQVFLFGKFLKNRVPRYSHLQVEYLALFAYTFGYTFLLLSVSSLNSIFRYAGVNFAFFLLPIALTQPHFLKKHIITAAIIGFALLQGLFFILYITQVPAYGF